MLNEDSTPFQASTFFQNCRDELKNIARTATLSSNIKKTNKKIESLRSSSKTNQLDEIFIKNIVVDYLRSNKLDYTYSVFMRETNLTSSDIASKKMLAEITHTKQQYENHQKFNISVIQLLVQALRVQRNKGQTLQCGIQANTLLKTGQSNNILLVQNKMKQVREQVEQCQKKYYEKLFENWKSKQKIEMQEKINRQNEKKIKKQVQKVNQKYQQIIKKIKQNQEPQKIKNQVQRLLTKNRELKYQNQKVLEENKELKHFKISHNCRQTKQWKQLSLTITRQRKQLEQKKKQLDLALRNITTKVEDLVQKKKCIQEQNNKKNKVGGFMEEERIHRKNKDHMIETIYGEMKQMNKRIEILDQQNNKLRANVKIQTKKKQQQEKNKERISQNNNYEEQCRKCQIGQKFKKKMKNVLIGVTQQQIIQFNKENQEMIEEESSEDEQEYQKNRLQKQKIEDLKSSMRMIKRKIKLLGQDF